MTVHTVALLRDDLGHHGRRALFRDLLVAAVLRPPGVSRSSPGGSAAEEQGALVDEAQWLTVGVGAIEGTARPTA